MIFKKIDDKSVQINQLEELLKMSQSEAQKRLIASQLKKVKSGYEAEKENAYYLDFELEKSENLIILHDIRIEHDGRSAQFDHILISRFGIEILESKSSTGSMSINSDGSIVIKNAKYTNTFPNPLEQSRRHGLVLRDFIAAHTDLSKRIDLLGGIEITSRVLINPKTTLLNSELPEGFERADSFLSKRRKELDDISFVKALSLLSKGMKIDKAKEIAEIIVAAHKPVEYDYSKKFKIAEATTTKTVPEDASAQEEPQICPRCKEGTLLVKQVKSKKAQEKYGNSEFIGCSNYPKCRYTQSVDSATESQ